MILVKNLFLKFTREYYALYQVNMDIADGESVAFVGEDESGKTSLLRIFAKLEKMTKGEVYIKDIPLEKLDYHTDINAGYVPSTPVFFEKKTVYENFKYILKTWGYKDAEIETKINEIIIEYAIEKIKDRKIKELSLEEKYVLSFIRLTLRGELELLMVDNIFDRLNEATMDVVCQMIKKLKSKKTTLIIATTKASIAQKLCKRNYYFKNGSVADNLTALS
jgi:ABC-type multidrug transport system ATPase subunit